MIEIEAGGTGPGRSFDGIGGISSNGMSRLLQDYADPVRARIMELLFSPSRGAGLHHLKIEIGSDANSSAGTEPCAMRSEDGMDIERDRQLPFAREALRFNPGLTLEALRWGTPAWVRTHGDKTRFYLEYLTAARGRYGIEFDWLAVDQNEGSFDRDWVVESLAPALRSGGFPGVRLVAAEGEGRWDIADMAADDPDLAGCLDALSVHYRQNTTEVARCTGKKLWLSEDLAPMQHSFRGGALEVAGRIIAMYAVGRMTRYLIHPILEAQYDSTPFHGKGILKAVWPWSGRFEIHKGYWIVAHFTRFTRQGWRFLDAGCRLFDARKDGTTGGVLTFLDPEGGARTVVLLNCGDAAAACTVRLDGAAEGSVVDVFRTTESLSFAPERMTVGRGGAVPCALPPLSLTTLTTMTGTEPPCADGEGRSVGGGFPLPFRVEEDTPPRARQPLYFVDQGGAFEMHPGPGGRVVRQTVTEKLRPSDWPLRRTPEPYSLFGSPEWRDYRVRTSGRTAEGYLVIGGRVTRSPKSAAPPIGYLLVWKPSGHWALRYGREPLAGGRTDAGDGWIELGLDFRGDRVTAECNGCAIATVVHGEACSGQAVLGCGYHEAEFRRIAVEPNGGTPSIVRHSVAAAGNLSGNWISEPGDFRDYARSTLRSAGTGARIRLRVEGTAFHLIGRKLPGGGCATVSVDGIEAGRLQCAHALPRFRSRLASVMGLPPGGHEVELTVETDAPVLLNAVETEGGNAAWHPLP